MGTTVPAGPRAVTRVSARLARRGGTGCRRAGPSGCPPEPPVPSGAPPPTVSGARGSPRSRWGSRGLREVRRERQQPTRRVAR
ncbi:hypothetical protein BG846_04184 [Streptomyces fradiae ATCC 10745 = DSM 40063]|uniref:Uncharacterized protein n=1 Tax=Streptomyces fradiae ATCC 10745 = DSM 40063 TaxID=1319510 RepID=A0A1Y2NTE3_STRFR|nr:hypothetical protein BG846_04184 [Streptomyces fradiae ATCC 10745 = DSM 40063]